MLPVGRENSVSRLHSLSQCKRLPCALEPYCSMYHAQAMINSFPLFSDLHQFDNITPYFMADPICRYGSMLYLHLNWAEQQEQLINLTCSRSTWHVTDSTRWNASIFTSFSPRRLVLRYWKSWTMIPVSFFDMRSISCSSFSPLDIYSLFCCALILWLDFLFDCFFLYIEVLLSFNCLPHTLFFINLCNQYSILEAIHM